MKYLTFIMCLCNCATGHETQNPVPWWYMGVRPILITVIRTPIDAITQNQQVHATNLIPTIKQITQKGICAFYRGALPRFLSESCRSFYMIPAWTYSQGFFHTQYPEVSRDHPYLRKVFAGCVFGTAEAIFGTPMNRISVLLNTQKNQFNLREFGLRDFYRGAGLSFINSSFGCTVYLMSDCMIRQSLKNYRDGSPLKNYDYLISGITTSLIYSSATGPLITLSTRVQHALPSSPQKASHVLRTLIQQNKLSGLFAGWHLRFLQLTIFSTIESVFLDQIDRNLD